MKRKFTAKLEKIRNLREFEPFPKKQKVDAQKTLDNEEIKENFKNLSDDLGINQKNIVNENNDKEKIKVSLENIELLDNVQDENIQKEDIVPQNDGF
jgi:hypothetical protein